MNFYVRYMDSFNFRVTPNVSLFDFMNYGITEIRSNYETPLLHNRILRGFSSYGPTNYGSVRSAAWSQQIGTSTANRWGLGNQIDLADPTYGNGPIRVVDWEYCGSQPGSGAGAWDMTDKETFKDQVIDYYTNGMALEDANKQIYEQYFGEGYRDLDYNVIIYWGTPLNEDGTEWDYPCAFECIYIGNTPLYDEIVAG